jgi:EAL domain-containing protein (putative c-di-GMP-specific phosphodiesterase class I)
MSGFDKAPTGQGPFGAGTPDPLSLAIAERDRRVMEQVERAVRRGQLALAFQPVVSARDPRKVSFYEGLVRIMDDTGRIIPARDFMWAAETREAGRLIDCAALEIGLQTLSRNPTLRLSVNMSARSIGYPRWVETLNRGLASDPTVGERLILEITESSAMIVPDLVAVFMEGLQGKGVAFALDDFGAGYTAFRYLRDFYFDIVKIDGQFIADVHANADNQILTRTLIDIAAHFEMFTVAEQVESPADSAWLVAAGVDCLQGYLYGMPTVQPHWMAPGTGLGAAVGAAPGAAPGPRGGRRRA